MSHLQSARQALLLELEYAKQGLSYYHSRVESLEAALQQVDALADNGEPKAKRTASMKKAKALTKEKPRTAAKASTRNGKAAAKSSKSLPRTGGDFWLEVITEEPKSAVDIANAAASKLNLDPAKDVELVHILKQRVAPMLNTLVTTQRIRDNGAGRERRFFKQ